MKLFVFSDVHLDWVTHGVLRFTDVAAAIRQVIKDAQVAADKKDVAVAFLGDHCNPDDVASVLRAVAFIQDMAIELNAASIPSVWIAGNHDVLEDGSGITTLAPLMSLTWDSKMRFINVAEQPSVVYLHHVPFLALPFTAASHPYDPAEAIRQARASYGVRHFLSHLAFPGVQPGEETTEMPRGREVLFPVDLLREGDLVLQGHYHRRQSLEVNGATVHIPGAIQRLTFGEEANEPAYLVVEVG